MKKLFLIITVLCGSVNISAQKNLFEYKTATFSHPNNRTCMPQNRFTARLMRLYSIQP
ncbi:MAG: hypothetical protein II908_05725 [Bacteroidaceae bacterium]|nr:hypothetical protein [Bacteroidaceae bacterium]